MTGNITTAQETRISHDCGEAIDNNGRPKIQFEDLPQDVMYRILSQLQPKEFARTSILSSKLGCMWPACPRLTFDGVSVYKCDRSDLRQDIGKFVRGVYAVLQKHRGKVVETFEIKMHFDDSRLVRHLDDWINFIASSRTKNLTLDLKPKRFWEYSNRYVFPFKLLGCEGISRLRSMQLSFVSLKPPAWFTGFPNLRKLHLQLLHGSRTDLEDVLSHCCNLEWLHIDRCHLNDDLTVDGPLSRLLYLYVEYCRFTKIELHAVNLATFEYEGSFIPIDLSNSLKLKSANIQLCNGGSAITFQHVLVALLNGLPNVQNLTLNIGLHLEKQWLWDNALKFSYLRHLQLCMYIRRTEVDKVLYSLSFLRATPLIERLEVHFSGSGLWFADVGPRRHDLGQCKYSYLKDIWITGFKGARGQVEFLLHVVENAPALEAVTITTQAAYKEVWPYRDSEPPFQEAKRIAITSLSVALKQNVKIDIV